MKALKKSRNVNKARKTKSLGVKETTLPMIKKKMLKKPLDAKIGGQSRPLNSALKNRIEKKYKRIAK